MSEIAISEPIFAEGLLVIDKPVGVTSFDVVARVRRILQVKRVGHAGTLDPFASGILLVLVSRSYTRRSDELMLGEKRYRAGLFLGRATDTHDVTGQLISQSAFRPSLEEIERALSSFRGCIWQVPPMFSAKSIGGKRLYELARRGEVVQRKPVQIDLQVQLVSYSYPHLNLEVISGKGAYMRSLAHDLGALLGCGAHLESLIREKSGPFSLNMSFEGRQLFELGDNELRKPLFRTLRSLDKYKKNAKSFLT